MSSDKINFMRQNIECGSGMQVTVGHRTLANQNLPVSRSDKIPPVFGHLKAHETTLTWL